MNKKDNNQEKKAPDFSGIKMKKPENSDLKTPSGTKKHQVDFVGAPLLIILTILLLLILTAMYLWLKTLPINETSPIPATPIERPTAEQNKEPESTAARAQTDAMLITSPSDDLSAIEADLKATNFDNLDTELNSIESEIDNSVSEQQ